MPRPFVVRLLICVACLGTFLYLYVEKQIEVTRYRLKIPSLAKEVHRIQEDNVHLHYQIDQFENPVHLLEMSRKPEYGHLHYPLVTEILEVEISTAKDSYEN